MPPKGWTSGRPEGIVKAVRLSEATIERIARHVERLQAQLSFVRVNEGMAIRNLIDIGLDTAEGCVPQQPTPQQVHQPQPAIPLALEPAPATETPLKSKARLNKTLSPHAQRGLPQEMLQKIADTAAQYDKLSSAKLSQLLFDRNIYRAKDRKSGEEKPVNRGTLQKWLDQARDEGML